MKFSKLIIEKEFALIVFEYQGKKIHLIENQSFNENSDIAKSDRVVYQSVENDWIGRSLSIEENEQDSGEKEYSVTF